MTATRSQQRVIGELTVEIEDLIVRDGFFRRPVEIPRNQAFGIVVGFVIIAVFRNARPVPAVVEDKLVTGLGIIEQPFQAGENAFGGGPPIQACANGLRRNTAVLQDGAHGENVIDAAFKPLRRIRVVVDSNEQGLLFLAAASSGNTAFTVGPSRSLAPTASAPWFPDVFNRSRG